MIDREKIRANNNAADTLIIRGYILGGRDRTKGVVIFEYEQNDEKYRATHHAKNIYYFENYIEAEKVLQKNALSMNL